MAKTGKIVKLTDFCGMHVGTGQVVAFIKKLYREENFSHMWYEVGSKAAVTRFTIFAHNPSPRLTQYFKDRCPGMIEDYCRGLAPEAASMIQLPDGVEVINHAGVKLEKTT